MKSSMIKEKKELIPITDLYVINGGTNFGMDKRQLEVVNPRSAAAWIGGGAVSGLGGGPAGVAYGVAGGSVGAIINGDIALGWKPKPTPSHSYARGKF